MAYKIFENKFSVKKNISNVLPTKYVKLCIQMLSIDWIKPEKINEHKQIPVEWEKYRDTIMTNNKLQLKPCEQINFVFNSFLMPAFFSGNFLSAHFLLWEIKLTMKFNCLTPFNYHGLTARLMVWAFSSWTHNLAFKSHGVSENLKVARKFW